MSKRQDIASLKSKVLKSPQYSAEPKGGKQGNSTEELNVKIISDIQKINKEIEALYQERRVLVQLIDRLEDNLERNVIRLHYINNYTWNEMSRELNWSVRQLQRFKESAINKLEKLVAL
ncbi:TPA: DUF1492 domain-containing protein [Streptococcus suis]